MAIEIKVPTLGESVTEATRRALAQEAGRHRRMDDPLVELETDKVTLEVNAPAAGTLDELLVAEGATVDVGAMLGRIAEGARNPPAAAKPAAAPKPAGRHRAANPLRAAPMAAESARPLRSRGAQAASRTGLDAEPRSPAPARMAA